MKLELIEDWHLFTKFWSVRLAALGSLLTSLFLLWPDSALYIWASMPEEAKAMIPEKAVQFVAVFITAMSMFARVVKQKSLKAENGTEANIPNPDEAQQ
jgi:hypothetical protein